MSISRLLRLHINKLRSTIKCSAKSEFLQPEAQRKFRRIRYIVPSAFNAVTLSVTKSLHDARIFFEKLGPIMNFYIRLCVIWDIFYVFFILGEQMSSIPKLM